MGSQKTSKFHDVEQEAHEWAVLLESGDLSEVETKRFEDWLAAHPARVDLLDSAVTIREALNTLQPSDLDDGLLHRSPEDRPVHGIRQMLDLVSRSSSIAVAAVCCVLVAAAVTYSLIGASEDESPPPPIMLESTHHRSKIGELREVILSDGTKLVLGPASSAIVSIYDQFREVELHTGMAFVAVARDESRPFTVRAGALTATALGTEFDVRRFADGYEVGVAEGQVLVSYPLTINHEDTGQPMFETLTSGQQIHASLRNGMADVEKVNVSDVASWRSGRWVYMDSPISVFIADLNRNSTVPITISDPEGRLSDLRIQGVFRGNDVFKHLISLESILPIVADTSDPAQILVRPAKKMEP